MCSTYLSLICQGGAGNGGVGVNGNPQVRLLMQHIQMAVQAGYLNPQILNQSLAPATLVLLNNMLSQINILQKLHLQLTTLASQGQGANSATAMQLNVHITKVKQHISNIQVTTLVVVVVFFFCYTHCLRLSSYLLLWL